MVVSITETSEKDTDCSQKVCSNNGELGDLLVEGFLMLTPLYCAWQPPMGESFEAEKQREVKWVLDKECCH